ncbi:MAG: hypothetical protein ACPGD5_07800 [Salibacteraceae bacterium]
MNSLFKFLLSFGFLICIFLASSCKKEEPVQECPTPEPWERFIGDYKVYDTAGNYLYDCDISQFRDTNSFGNLEVDYLLIRNFADNFDFSFEFPSRLDKNELYFGFHDSVSDYNGKHWYIASLFDDLGTAHPENRLENDSITLYFERTNIKFWVNEGQLYYHCECKHVAVKQ